MLMQNVIPVKTGIYLNKDCGFPIQLGMTKKVKNTDADKI